MRILSNVNFPQKISQFAKQAHQKLGRTKSPSKKVIAALLSSYFIAWFAYFFHFWSNSFIVNKTGGISAQHVNLWGDWAAHFTMGSAMAERGLLLTTSPFLLNAPFSYPFVADMLSAILIRMHLDFFLAFILPSFVFSCLIIIALFLFYKQLSKSIAIAVLASTIFLFNGGTGFLYYFQDIADSQQKVETALNPPREYTNIEDEHYRWISVITSMVFPQRAFTVGFPIALLLLTLLLQNTQKKRQSKLSKLLAFFSKRSTNESSQKLIFFATAAVIGLLPIIHTHSFLAVFILLSFWSVGDILTTKTKQEKIAKLIDWSIFAGIVAAIALPLISIFISGNIQHSFIKWYPGWYVGNDYPNETLLSFWFKNWSIVPVLSLMGFGLVIQKSSNKLRTFFEYVPFFALFLLTNLVLFQPFVWDNTKILVWASLGFSLLSAQFLHAMWKESKWMKPLVIAITIVICFSGFLDTYRALRFPLSSYQMYSAEEVALAAWTKANTDSDSIWLTGTYHNEWLFNLTGRQALATYTGWLWTHGYDYYQEDHDLRTMYQFPQNTALFEKYGIDYVVVGPFERREFNTDEHAFLKNFVIVQKTESYTVLKRSTQ
ncbi:MAG: hypothetical protein GW925_00245 [Candidatus Pacebacteria bacterium]|nr:hypothetical protein [Candidatus Paceibacterota bacterium]